MTGSSEAIKAAAGRVLMNTYGRYDLVLAKGAGCRVWDPEGNEYIDFLAGLAVASLGHADPAVAEAVAEQARRLVHVSNLYYTEPQVRLAQLLTEHCFADRCFFANSGAEANEAAIKLARKYALDRRGPGRHRVITLADSFHGRTLATLSATAQEKIHKGFTPLVDGFAYAPFGDLDALAAMMDDTVCAVLIEPIQGEGGVNVPPEGYLSGAAELCRKNDVLLIFDEVQVGLGRTGHLFAHQALGVEPDVMTLAKAIANGLPMGVCLAREDVAEHFGPGTHATTFGGTPLVSAAAIAVMDALLRPGFLDTVRRTGAYFQDRLRQLAGRKDYIADVRGMGLIWGLELTFPGGPVVGDLMRRGFLINCTQDRVLRFLPPLIVSPAEIDLLMPALEAAIDDAAPKEAAG
jgi:acetylornithine aminotransferase